jgi:integrase/recombinase XerD
VISADLPSLIQSFFTHRLLQQQASAHTIAGYRDCFRLLLHFAKEKLGRTPSKLRVEDVDAPFIGLFLDHLESVRKNSARTRNARLGAIHSFFQYVASEDPAHALHCQRILAVPNKRHERRPIEFLNREEIDALLAAPNAGTWLARRDRTLLLVAVQTGLRVSELIGLNCQHVVLEPTLMCAAWARAENNVVRPCVRKRQGCWKLGYTNAEVCPKIRSFPAFVAAD